MLKAKHQQVAVVETREDKPLVRRERQAHHRAAHRHLVNQLQTKSRRKMQPLEYVCNTMRANERGRKGKRRGEKEGERGE